MTNVTDCDKCGAWHSENNGYGSGGRGCTCATESKQNSLDETQGELLADVLHVGIADGEMCVDIGEFDSDIPSVIYVKQTCIRGRGMKYVWLNTLTGEFSKSWDETNERESGYKVAPSSTWKKIKYECCNDEDFEFNNLMRIA